MEGGTPEWCQQLLRHECGHAIDHAYRFSSRDDWQRRFGSPETEYSPETYKPRPYSKGFVRNLPNWYAQAHPDEDFAETFAVWLSLTPEEWREQYRGWKALEKLEFVHALMEEAKNTPPKVSSAAGASMKPASSAKRWPDTTPSGANSTPKIFPTSTMPICALYSEMASPTESPLRKSCAADPHRAGRFHRALDRATQIHRGHAGAQIDRALPAAEADLPPPPERARVSFDLAAYLAAMVTNHLHTGRFKRSV